MRSEIITSDDVITAIARSKILSTEEKTRVYFLLLQFVRGLQTEEEAEAYVRDVLANDEHACTIFIMYCFQNAVMSI